MQRSIHSVTRLFFVLLATCIGFSSCNKDIDDPGILVDVPKTFDLRLFEDLGQEMESLLIQVTTIEFQECENNTIDFILYNGEDRILLSLNDILSPDDCIEGNAPALINIPVSNLENVRYNVEITLKNAVLNSGILRLTPDRYILEMETLDGIQVQNPILLRIPEHTVWGTISYRSKDLSTAANSFIEDLESISEVDVFETGDYGYFYVISDQNILVVNNTIPEDLDFGRNFIYNYDVTNEDALNDILQSYRNTYGDDIHIYLHSADGQIW